MAALALMARFLFIFLNSSRNPTRASPFLGGWRGKCHDSGRRNGLGGAATTPGSYRQGELQSVGNNRIHPARELAKSKCSYSFRSFSRFQNHELGAFLHCLFSSNATESSQCSPKFLPHIPDDRSGAYGSLLVHIIECNSHTNPSYAACTPTAFRMQEVLSSVWKRVGSDS